MESITWSDSINELSASHSAFLGSVENPKNDNEVKHSGKTQFFHAKLSDILEIVRPLLSANGLSIMHFPSFNAELKVITIQQLVSHKSGQWIFSELCLPVASGSFMNSTQSVGSTITYGRRYLLFAFCGIAGKGDDDESAFRPETQVGQNTSYGKQSDANTIKFEKPVSSSLRELRELVKKHEIPDTIKDTWKAKYGVEELRSLKEEDAKAIVDEVKKVYEE